MAKAFIALTCLALAACGQVIPSQGATPATPAPRNQVGRYVIVHSPHVQRDTQLLDTWTGRTWLLVQVGADGPLIWEAVGRPDVIPQVGPAASDD